MINNEKSKIVKNFWKVKIYKNYVDCFPKIDAEALKNTSTSLTYIIGPDCWAKNNGIEKKLIYLYI